MAAPKTTLGQSVRDTKILGGLLTKKGVRLEDQEAPAGKELIGMRSGVPVYADIKNIYGPKSVTKVSETGDKTFQTPEQQRAEYQAREAPQAAAAMAPAAQPVQRFFPQGPASQPEKARIPQLVAPSQAEDFARERASAEARRTGKMGDYLRSTGQPALAKAFPNAEEIPSYWKSNEKVISRTPAPEISLAQRLLARAKPQRRPSYKF